LAEVEGTRGRTRWLIVVIAIVAVVVLGRSQVGSRLLSFDRSQDEPQAGQLEGRIWRIDGNTRTIQITARAFGIGATSVAVTDDTLVIVGSKEGGFGDLREGLRVRAAWEKRKDVRQARFVQVLDRATPEGAPASAPASSRPDRPATPATNAEPARVPTRVPPAAAPPTLSAPPTEPRRAAPKPTVKAAPEPPRATPQPAPSPATQATPPLTAPSREPDSSDPAAVIDWLLNRKD